MLSMKHDLEERQGWFTVPCRLSDVSTVEKVDGEEQLCHLLGMATGLRGRRNAKALYVYPIKQIPLIFFFL